MSAPTTAEVRETAALCDDPAVRAIQVPLSLEPVIAAAVRVGASIYARDHALPIAEHRDAAVAERDALAAEVARLREVIATKYAIERSSLGVSALVEERATIALAAGLGADASAEEIAARVGEMRGAMLAFGRADRALDHETRREDREARAAASIAWRDLARRLAEEAGRG